MVMRSNTESWREQGLSKLNTVYLGVSMYLREGHSEEGTLSFPPAGRREVHNSDSSVTNSLCAFGQVTSSYCSQFFTFRQ
jgi:hypothetical protein